jgi:hypothetical protein
MNLDLAVIGNSIVAALVLYRRGHVGLPSEDIAPRIGEL